MGFKVSNAEFEKLSNGGIRISISDSVTRKNMVWLTDAEWISVITEMSHKPENAEQHAKAEKFHLGK